MFIKNCIIDRYTDKNKNRQCITSGIKHWGLSGYSSVLPRIKFGVTGQVCSPQSPTISYRRPLAARQIRTESSVYQDFANAQARVLQPVPATVPSLQNTCFFARPDSVIWANLS